jgi:hypothetical protein
MKKIPTIYQRDWNGDRSRVLNEPHPDCSWVFAGEGTATQKIDGTSCLVRDGKLFKRRELKPGQVAPEGYLSEGADSETEKPSVGYLSMTVRRIDVIVRRLHYIPSGIMEHTSLLVQVFKVTPKSCRTTSL